MGHNEDKQINLADLKLVASEQMNVPGLDGFDLSSLRLSQDFQDLIGVKKLITTVPARVPDRQWFIRMHPHEEWRLATAVIELKEDREVYLVNSALWQELQGLIVPKMLFTAVNRQGVFFSGPSDCLIRMAVMIIGADQRFRQLKSLSERGSE